MADIQEIQHAIELESISDTERLIQAVLNVIAPPNSCSPAYIAAINTVIRNFIVSNNPLAIQSVPDKTKLEGTELGNISNQTEILQQILALLIPPNSSPDYIAKIHKAVKNNYGIDTLPIIKRLFFKKI